MENALEKQTAALQHCQQVAKQLNEVLAMLGGTSSVLLHGVRLIRADCEPKLRQEQAGRRSADEQNEALAEAAHQLKQQIQEIQACSG